MLPIPYRFLGIPVAIVLAASGVAMASPVGAADSPEAAVNELFDMIEAGDFAGLDKVVCSADRAAVLENFDLGAELGLESDDPLSDALQIEIGDRAVEPVGEEGDSATVRVTATMSISVAEDQMEDLVRAIIEADQGPDDLPASDADVEMMMGMMGSAFNQTQAFDEEVTIAREEGEWLVCGGLVEPVEPAIEETWATDGLCSLLEPEAVNSISELQYASAMGFEVVCTVSSSLADFDNYHSATLVLNEGYDMEAFRSAFPVDEELEVGGYPGFTSGDQLIVEAAPNVLQVTVSLGENPPPGADAIVQAVGLAELVLPRLSEVATPTAEPTPEPTPEVSLCESLPVEQLNELTGLGFDEASGDSSSCQYMSLDGEPGMHFVVAYVSEATLEDYQLWVPEYEDGSVAGQPAMLAGDQTIVELPDGAHVLDITVFLDSTDEGVTQTSREIGALVAEQLLPGLTAE